MFGAHELNRQNAEQGFCLREHVGQARNVMAVFDRCIEWFGKLLRYQQGKICIVAFLILVGAGIRF